jgi:hypothetical protein
LAATLEDADQVGGAAFPTSNAMESIPPTEERGSNGARATSGSPAANGGDAATQRLPALSAAGAGAHGQEAATQVMPSAPASPGAPSTAVQTPASAPSAARSTATPLTPTLSSSGREHCPVCACAVAPDQRYCVECGQRLVAARPTLMGDQASGAGAATPPKGRKSRFDWGPNGTLIAGIIALLLAMGVGILIGHYSASPAASKKATPIVVTGLGATGGAGTSAAATTAPATGGAGAAAGKSAGGGGSGGGHPTAAASKPTNPTVQLGQKGHGQGYQHGKFTGHFFGSENEEDAGEEGQEGEEEEGSGGGKKKK